MINYTKNLRDHNVRTHLRFLQIEEAFAQNGMLSLRDSETGLILTSLQLSQGLAEPPEPLRVAVIKALVEIQEKTHTPISLPDRDISREEVETVLRTAELLRGSSLTGTVAELRATVSREIANSLVHGTQSIDGVLLIRNAAPLSLFGLVIPLPMRETQINGMTVAQAELDRLRSKVQEAAQSVDSFDVTITPSADQRRCVVRIVQNSTNSAELG
jgi:hypothetical protein